MGWLSALQAWFGFEPAISPDEAPLLQAIANDPAADAPRLAYAEYLAGRQRPLGEYVRLALEQSHLDEFDPRYAVLQSRLDELLHQYGRRWLRPLQQVGLKPLALNQPPPAVWFKRGMIEHVVIDHSDIVPDRLQHLRELAPAVQKLTFERCEPDWQAMAASSAMACITSLDLSRIAISPADLQTLANSPYFTSLQELDLSNQEQAAELTQVLAAATTQKNLKSLTMQFCHLDAKCMTALAQSENCAHLRHLDVANNHLQDAGIQAIVQGPHLSQLVSLRLANNDLTDIGVHALAAGQFPQLRELCIESSRAGQAAYQALGRAPWAAGLKVLHLDWNCAADDAVLALLQSGRFSQLQRLHLNGNSLTDGGLRRLLDLPTCGQLRVLDLSSNDLTSAGIALLVTAPTLKELRNLVLISVELTRRDREQLIERFGEGAVQF